DFMDAYSDILKNKRPSYNILIRKAIEDDGTLLFPERLTKAFLDEQRKEQGNYIFSCNPAGTPILMADYSYKSIEDVVVGDVVMGFSNESGRNKLVPSIVQYERKTAYDIQGVWLDNGNMIRCTPDHNWFTGRQDTTHRLYAPVHVGSKLLN